MVKIKEGFREGTSSFCRKLLANYQREPLINNLYVRKIGFFPRVKYHFSKKNMAVTTPCLFIVRREKDGIVSSVNNIPWRNTNISSSLGIPIIPGVKWSPWIIAGYTSEGKLRDQIPVPSSRFRVAISPNEYLIYKIIAAV